MHFRSPISPETGQKVILILREKLGLNKKFLLLIASAIIGIVVALILVLLRTLLNEIVHAHISNQFYYFLPAVGGLIVGLVVYWVLGEPQGAGIEQTIKMIKVDSSKSGPRHVFVRFFTAFITLGSGGSAGKESPSVHIGGLMGSLFGRLLPFPDSYVRTLIGAGAAAGISSAFSTPIAGAFFALEILLADFTLDTFSMIVVAAVASTAVTQSFGAVSENFVSSEYHFSNPVELLFFAGMGVVGGMVAVFFIRWIEISVSFFEHIKIPLWIKPAIGGLTLGIILIFFPEIRGEGYETINGLLTGDVMNVLRLSVMSEHLGVFSFLILLIFFKVTGTAITLGSGGSGGTIVPALFLGALVGILSAEITLYFMPQMEISKSTWALIGMSSVLAATTHAPLFSITMFFEVTRNYEVILPVLVVVTTSILVSKHYLGGSLYSLSLRKEGIRLYQGMEQSIMEQISIEDIMHKDINLINSNVSLGNIIQGFLHTDYTAGFVIDTQGRYLGLVTIDDVRDYVDEHELYNLLLASELARNPDIWVLPKMSLLEGLERMDNHDMVWLPVLQDDRSENPIAYITRKDIIAIYNREIRRRDTHSMVVESGKNSLPDSLAITDNLQIETLAVPKQWVGKCLKDIDLRAKFNVTVIGISALGSQKNIVPDVNYLLKPNEQLIIVGAKEDIQEIFTQIEKNSGLWGIFKKGV